MSVVRLSERLKISSMTVNQSATRGEKIAKKNKLKLLQNKYSTFQGMLYIKTSKGYTSESTYGIAEKNDLSHSDKITS